MSREDKVFRAIEAITGKHIVSVNEESKKYCFKCFDGSVKAIDKEFVNDFANV